MAKVKSSHNQAKVWNWEKKKKKKKINNETVISYKLTKKELNEYLENIENREVNRRI